MFFIWLIEIKKPTPGNESVHFWKKPEYLKKTQLYFFILVTVCPAETGN